MKCERPAGLNPVFTSRQWSEIDQVGQVIDGDLKRHQVRLWMGGEPTFIADHARIDCQASPEWQTIACGPEKRRIAGQLWQAMATQIAPPGSLRFYGVGKCYPGEAENRWALGCYWNLDRTPLWNDQQRLIPDDVTCHHTIDQAAKFLHSLAIGLGLPPEYIIPVIDAESDLALGYLLPLQCLNYSQSPHEQRAMWSTCAWQLNADEGSTSDRQATHHATATHLCATPSKGSIGTRLPLNSFNWATPKFSEANERPSSSSYTEQENLNQLNVTEINSICVALTVEIYQGNLQVFIPPIANLQCFQHLIQQIEITAGKLNQPIQVAGYLPTQQDGLTGFQITPDPGVIEVNIHPVSSWNSLVQLNQTLYQLAHQCGLICEKQSHDGLALDTGGGAHITLGGASTADSPILRRPDLLRSLLTYWQHHPSLSYLFSGLFVGPTSQSPRTDETQPDNLYELELALQHLQPQTTVPPAVIDRLLRHHLADLSGNTHRTEICIDKLFASNRPQGCLGVVEFRSFSMPPTVQMRLLQLLLLRGLIAWLWREPYQQSFVRWGTHLHDRYFLPHYLQQDFRHVLNTLRDAGYHFHPDWFEPFWQFRFPRLATSMFTLAPDVTGRLMIHRAIEPWPVLADSNSSSNSRPVDASMERIQITIQVLSGSLDECQLTCNNIAVPLMQEQQEYLGAVRFRARPINGLLDSHEHESTQTHLPLQLTLWNLVTGQAITTWHYTPHQLTRQASPQHPTIAGISPPDQADDTSRRLITLDLRQVRPDKEQTTCRTEKNPERRECRFAAESIGEN